MNKVFAIVKTFAFTILALYLPSGLSFSHAAVDDKLETQLAVEFKEFIQPTLLEKCGNCHLGPEANAGINLEVYYSLERILDADRKWKTILRQIENGSMPPENADHFSDTQKQRVVGWIKQTFELVDNSKPFPGSVTIRKLNKTEYRNTIRDLLGVDYQPAAGFPGDDVGHGFDNVADVLSLPPVLMEKYLDAAQEISQRAIVDFDNPPLKVDLAGASFSDVRGKTKKRDGKLAFYSNATAEKEISIPFAGDYELRINAYADRAGDEEAKMSIWIDGSRVETVEVKSNRRKPGWHTFRLTFANPGKIKLQIAFENDYYVPRAIGRQDRNLYVVGVYVSGPRPDYTHRKYLDLRRTDLATAKKFIGEFLPRAFRKPVDEQLKQNYLDLFQQSRNKGLSFFESIHQVAQAAIVSPRFLYKLETPVTTNTIRNLDNFELATALSYFLWSSTPDDDLLRAAGRSELINGQKLSRQVDRLLEDDRSIALVENFAAQWLNLPVLRESQPDPELFFGVDRQLLQDMATETKMLVADVFRRDASILELLESDFSFVNERLARHYEIDDVDGHEFRRVSLPVNSRTGMLTHASILTLTSNPNRTSPVKRGKWIMENILGDEPPPPLASVVPLDEQQSLSGSLRERMQQHRTDPSCASCHATMDALGFALENYDAVGRFRTKDNGFEIDSNSEMPDGTKLAGASGLQGELRSTYKSKFVRCFSEKLLTFAIGRGLKYYDRRAVDEIIERAAKNGYRFSSFVKGVVMSDPFRKRGKQRTSESDVDK